MLFVSEVLVSECPGIVLGLRFLLFVSEVWFSECTGIVLGLRFLPVKSFKRFSKL